MMIHRPARNVITTIAILAATLFSVLSARSASAGPVAITTDTPQIDAGVPTTITISGTDFCMGNKVRLYRDGKYVGPDFPATRDSATTLSSVTIDFDGPTGYYSIGAIDANNNCGGSQTAPTAAIRIAPVITSVSPSYAVAGSPTMTLTITGRGFSPGSIIRWNDTVLPAVYVSGTQLTATIPSMYLSSAGAALLYVSDATGTIFNATGTDFHVRTTADQ